MFFFTPFIIAISISNFSNYLIKKYGESYGYINLQKSKRVGLRQILNTVICVLPIINVLYSVLCIHNLYCIYKDTNYSNDSFNKMGTMKKASKEKKIIDKVFNMYNKRELKDQLILDGVKSERINNELKKIENDNKYIIKSRNNKKYKKLKAMSDAELWLESILCDINLTEKEKLKLYRKYLRDFYREDKRRKPKAINKTLKLSKKKT